MAASRGGRSSPWATRTVAGSFILLSFPRDPLADVGRAMEQLGALLLAFHQEVDDVDADYGDFPQVQGGVGTADLELVRDLPEMLGLHGPNQPNGRPLPIRAALDLERHPSPPFRLGACARGVPPNAPARRPLGALSAGAADLPSSNCPASAQPWRRTLPVGS